MHVGVVAVHYGSGAFCESFHVIMATTDQKSWSDVAPIKYEDLVPCNGGALVRSGSCIRTCFGVNES
jgi:hypothetical protein